MTRQYKQYNCYKEKGRKEKDKYKKFDFFHTPQWVFMQLIERLHVAFPLSLHFISLLWVSEVVLLIAVSMATHTHSGYKTFVPEKLLRNVPLTFWLKECKNKSLSFSLFLLSFSSREN